MSVALLEVLPLRLAASYLMFSGGWHSNLKVHWKHFLLIQDISPIKFQPVAAARMKNDTKIESTDWEHVYCGELVGWWST